MRFVPPVLPAALQSHRSLVGSYLSSRIPYVLCKCNIADHERIRPEMRRKPSPGPGRDRDTTGMRPGLEEEGRHQGGWGA